MANRKSIDDVIEFIESKGCRYLEGEYNRNTSKLLILYKCGHSDIVRYDVFRNAKTFLCRKCQKEKVGNIFKSDESLIHKLLGDVGLTFICFPNGYKNGSSKVTYICEHGHTVTVQIETIKRKRKCSECAFIEQYNNRRGYGHPLWNGGTSSIYPLIKGSMIEWRKNSIKACNYKCVISGGTFNDVHHLYGFNMILEESLSNLNISNKKFYGEYTEDEICSIIEECKQLHKEYPLGVCLRKDIHVLFHKIYGARDNTPEQFYNFVDRIKANNIII